MVKCGKSFLLGVDRADSSEDELEESTAREEGEEDKGIKTWVSWLFCFHLTRFEQARCLNVHFSFQKTFYSASLALWNSASRSCSRFSMTSLRVSTLSAKITWTFPKCCSLREHYLASSRKRWEDTRRHMDNNITRRCFSFSRSLCRAKRWASRAWSGITRAGYPVRTHHPHMETQKTLCLLPHRQLLRPPPATPTSNSKARPPRCPGLAASQGTVPPHIPHLRFLNCRMDQYWHAKYKLNESHNVIK